MDVQPTLTMVGSLPYKGPIFKQFQITEASHIELMTTPTFSRREHQLLDPLQR